MGELLADHAILHRLKAVRQELGMSLAALSEKTGIDQGALSKLENGQRVNPTLRTLSRVANALGKKLICDLQEA